MKWYKYSQIWRKWYSFYQRKRALKRAFILAAA
jgi:hypothetical protein